MPEVKVQTFRVTAAVDREIRRHGEETYPHECCGRLSALTATRRRPSRCRTRPRKGRGAVMVRPSDYRLAEQRAQEFRRGTRWGSTIRIPITPARPSQDDLDHAWPTFAYIIVAVKAIMTRRGSARRSAEGPKAGDMTVWFLKEDRSEFEEGELMATKILIPTSAAAVHRQEGRGRSGRQDGGRAC